jgi:hypothetical protein
MTVLARLAATDLHPISPDDKGMPGAAALDTLMSWSMHLGLLACAFAAIFSGGAIALGMTSRHPHWVERGKVGVLCSVLGALVIGSAVTLVNKGLHLA